MKVFAKILEILDTPMTEPQPYGWFHLLFCALTVLFTVWLCRRRDSQQPERVRRVVFWVAVVVTLLEIYKQINFSFAYDGGVVTFDFEWYSFPFQFCSTPMYVGLLTGIFRRGRVHKALCAFLATYAVFAGLSVMAYPVQIFIETVGINVQTCICHGSMIAVGGLSPLQRLREFGAQDHPAGDDGLCHGDAPCHGDERGGAPHWHHRGRDL